MIGVLGATGRTGGATVRHLRRHGVHVRAFTRDPAGAAARAIRGPGVDVIAVDMGSNESGPSDTASADALDLPPAQFLEPTGVEAPASLSLRQGAPHRHAALGAWSHSRLWGQPGGN